MNSSQRAIRGLNSASKSPKQLKWETWNHKDTANMTDTESVIDRGVTGIDEQNGMKYAFSSSSLVIMVMITYLLHNRLKSTGRSVHSMITYLTLIHKLYKSHHRGVAGGFLQSKEITPINSSVTCMFPCNGNLISPHLSSVVQY